MKRCTEQDHKMLMERLINLSEEYSFIRLSYIGTSVMGRPIPIVVLGDEDAKRGVLYVSTPSGLSIGTMCIFLIL